MGPKLPVWWGASSPETIEQDVRRVADRLRNLSDARLSAPGPGGSPADAARDLAQQLSDAAQGVEERASGTPPVPRMVPRLGDFAVGDQVAVTGQDLVAALRAVSPGDPVWWAEGRVSAADLAGAAGELVAAVRRRL